MRLIASLAVLLFLPLTTFADRHYVNLDSTNPIPPFSEWSTAATNIQEAINAATDGDTVMVTNGTYLLPGTLDVSKGITLVSANGWTHTVLNGSGSLFGVLSVNHSNAVVNGFTVIGGHASMVSGTGSGAAGASLAAGLIQNCRIMGNSIDSISGSGNHAAGLYAVGGHVRDCTISGNSLGTASGSGIVAAGVCISGMGDVVECDITLNDIEDVTSSAGSAAGVYCSGGTIVDQCNIASNATQTASSSGGDAGGVHCVNGAVVRRSSITANSLQSISGSGNSAGGVCCRRGGLVERCLIAGNLFGGGSGVGGAGAGLSCSETGTVRNCVVVRNSITNTVGGEVSAAAGAYCSNTGLLQNCTVVSNRVVKKTIGVGRATGGIYCSDGGRVWNSIAYFNEYTNSIRNFMNSNNVDWLSCCVTPNPGGVGNITSDPKLADLKSWDCHLLSNSPCIDRGSTNGAPDEDFDGVPRPLDGNNDGTNAYDIGAYEFLNTNADSDADSLPDFWEVARGLDPRVATTTNGAAGDPDGDGADNQSEYVADTDPLASTSLFSVVQFSGGDDRLVQFSSSASRIYSLQYSDNLADPAHWDDVIGQTNQTGAAGSRSLSDTNAADFRAYRVLVRFP